MHYERWLAENNAIDFQDMINRSAKILREAKENQDDLGFRHIIVDEYQNISRQRFDLTKALSEAAKARIMAVRFCFLDGLVLTGKGWENVCYEM